MNRVSLSGTWTLEERPGEVSTRRVLHVDPNLYVPLCAKSSLVYSDKAARVQFVRKCFPGGIAADTLIPAHSLRLPLYHSYTVVAGGHPCLFVGVNMMYTGGVWYLRYGKKDVKKSFWMASCDGDV